MLTLSHKNWITFSGITWLLIGGGLFTKGIFLILGGISLEESTAALPFLHNLAVLTGGIEQAAVVIIACALLIGRLKARMVLSKTINRVITHIKKQKDPLFISSVYQRNYFILIGSMMFLGMALKRVIPYPDVMGAIDLAIGSALIQGGVGYFREGVFLKANFSKL